MTRIAGMVWIEKESGGILMRHAKLQKVVLAALFAALTYVATNLIHIPTPGTNGYVNLGDCMVLLGAFLLGPVYGAAAGGIGSMLADLLLGYMSYAPFTLLIKGLMGLTAALLFRAAEKKTGTTVAAVTAGLAAECLMVLGYFAVESTALGYGLAALASVPGNAIQGVVGLALGAALYQALSHVPVIRQAIHTR